jgi:hypothetical protein
MEATRILILETHQNHHFWNFFHHHPPKIITYLLGFFIPIASIAVIQQNYFSVPHLQLNISHNQSLASHNHLNHESIINHQIG